MATILLVDDDALQASSRKSILETRFHKVWRVADAVEALCMVDQPDLASEVSLVVAGLNLPGPGLPELIDELQSRLPDIPVLVLGRGTGNTTSPSPRVHILQPPFGAADLLAAVDRVLNSVRA